MSRGFHVYHSPTNGIPRLANFAQAIDYWRENQHEIRPHHSDYGFLGGNAKRFRGQGDKVSTIRYAEQYDEVIIRMYDTDVVTFHRDGSIVLVPFETKATNEFVRNVLPRNRIYPEYRYGSEPRNLWGQKIRERRNNRPNMVSCDDAQGNTRLFQIVATSGVVLHPQSDGTYLPVEGVTPWVFHRADRQRIATNLASYRYRTFCQWASSFRKVVRRDEAEVRDSMTPEAICQFAGNGQTSRLGWNVLLHTYWERAEDVVRKAIYEENNCVRAEKIEHLGYSDVAAYMRNVKDYAWLEDDERYDAEQWED